MSIREVDRVMVYFMGILFVSLGIVLCVKSELGVSPISSVPYSISYLIPLTFGILTMLYHFANSILQYILERKIVNIKIFLQIPVAFLFGVIIDFLKQTLVFEPQNFFFKILLMALSILSTAFGMHLMLSMKLVQNPPDGTVKLIAILLNKNVGTVKVAYDVIMVIFSVILSVIGLHKIIGFGIATICSALFVGRTLTLLQITFRLEKFVD